MSVNLVVQPGPPLLSEQGNDASHRCRFGSKGEYKSRKRSGWWRKEGERGSWEDERERDHGGRIKHIYKTENQGLDVFASWARCVFLIQNAVRASLVGDGGALLGNLLGGLGDLVLGGLLGAEDLRVGLLDDGADVLDDVGSELVGLLLVGALLGEDDRLDVGGNLGEDLGELVGELLGLVTEGVELLEESVRDLGRLGDDGRGAGAELVVESGSLGDDVLDDGGRLLDEGGDALEGGWCQ